MATADGSSYLLRWELSPPPLLVSCPRPIKAFRELWVKAEYAQETNLGVGFGEEGL